MNDTDTSTRPPMWATVLRAALSLVAVVALAWWFLVSLYLVVLRCDEGCSGDQADSLVYPIQFGLTLVGVGLGVAGLALGFTARRARSSLMVAGAAGCFLVWGTLVMSGSL